MEGGRGESRGGSSTGGARGGVGFDYGRGRGRAAATRGLRARFDDRRGRSGRGRGGVVVVGRHHAGENGRDGGCGRRLSRGGGGRGCGSMMDEEGPAVHPRCGVLWVSRFGITWRGSESRNSEEEKKRYHYKLIAFQIRKCIH